VPELLTTLKDVEFVAFLAVISCTGRSRTRGVHNAESCGRTTSNTERSGIHLEFVFWSFTFVVSVSVVDAFTRHEFHLFYYVFICALSLSNALLGLSNLRVTTVCNGCFLISRNLIPWGWYALPLLTGSGRFGALLIPGKDFTALTGGVSPPQSPTKGHVAYQLVHESS